MSAQSASLPPRDLAALAAACLLIDDARLYGLIDGGPKIDRARCWEIVEKARAEGIVPEQEEIERKAIGIMVELGVVRV